MMKILIKTFVYLTIFLQNFQAVAQEYQNRLALRSPHDAIWVHLYYLQPEHYDPGLSATVFGDGDSLVRVDWAIKLKQIMDGEGLVVQMNLLPREFDYQDTVSNQPYYTPFPEALPQIYLEKRDSFWFYSNESVREIPALHQKVYPLGTHQLVSLFAESAGKKFLGISLWQLAGLAILMIASFIFYLIVAWSLRLIVKQLSKSIQTVEHYKDYVKSVARIGSLYLLVWMLKLFFPLLQFPAQANMVMQTLFKVTLTILIAILMMRVVKLFASYLRVVAARTENRMDDQIVPMAEQILKIMIAVVAALNVLHVLDFNVAALIAGVSIGGLALALAAQDTVKNFLGSVMIFTDKPFQIGDWVEGDGFAGTVIEVGFRSTRIKTPDTSIISVPNGNMANVSVNNKGVRQYRLFATTIGITYDTPPDLIDFFIKGLKEICIKDPDVADQDCYIYLHDLGPSSINIFVRCYMIASTYDDELRIRESLYFALIRWAASIGVRFAFPSSTLYIEEIPGQVSLSPTYKIDPAYLEKRWQEFFIKEETAAKEV